jgi:hypothetical protein
VPYQLVAGTGPFNVDLTGAGKGKRLDSWHMATTSATVGQIHLRDGSVSGPLVARINLAGNSSASQSKKHYAPHLLMFPLGLFVEVVSGAITGSVDLR